MIRRQLGRALGGLVTLAACGAVWAQPATTFPSRPVTFVVPFAPGGITDGLARLIAEQAGRKWNRPVVVENVAGGGTLIGTRQVAAAPADGHTVLLTSFGFVINQITTKNLPYDPRSLTPLNLVGLSPNVLYLHPSQKIGNVAELVAFAKANPDKLTFASSGNLTSPHFAAELFGSLTGSQVVHVPYRGTGPAMADVLGGQVSGIFDTMQSMPYAKSGKLTAIAVASDKRLSTAPELPTFAEAGLPGMVISSWFGFFVPSATPDAVRQNIFATLQEVLAQPDVKARIVQFGVEPSSADQRGFQKFLDDELQRWAGLIKSRGLKLD